MAATLKDDVIELIRRLPDNVTLPDIMEELYVRQKIERGLTQLDNGQRMTTDEAKQRLRRWLA
ncbi:MAG: hypothetical protein ACKVP0_09870 [Pirellulaceae bacterium]